MSKQAAVEITDANFGESTGRVTVLELWAPWCAACGSRAPTCDSIGRDNAGRVQLARCDIDANRQVASALQVRTVPMVVVFGPDGSEIGRAAGRSLGGGSSASSKSPPGTPRLRQAHDPAGPRASQTLARPTPPASSATSLRAH